MAASVQFGELPDGSRFEFTGSSTDGQSPGGVLVRYSDHAYGETGTDVLQRVSHELPVSKLPDTEPPALSEAPILGLVDRRAHEWNALKKLALCSPGEGASFSTLWSYVSDHVKWPFRREVLLRAALQRMQEAGLITMTGSTYYITGAGIRRYLADKL